MTFSCLLYSGSSGNDGLNLKYGIVSAVPLGYSLRT
jgi:hypothetical protein